MKDQKRPTHPEAFCLMTYSDASENGEAKKEGTVFELIWNTRDGVTPFIIGSKAERREDRIELKHYRWGNDLAIPYFIPPVGMRVFIDGETSGSPAIATVTQEIRNKIADALGPHLRADTKAMAFESVWKWEAVLKAIFKK
jgi:hypothetical protein